MSNLNNHYNFQDTGDIRIAQQHAAAVRGPRLGAQHNASPEGRANYSNNNIKANNPQFQSGRLAVRRGSRDSEPQNMNDSESATSIQLRADSLFDRLDKFVCSFFRDSSGPFPLSAAFVDELLEAFIAIMPPNAQPLMVKSPVIFVGDTHGQLDVVVEIIEKFGLPSDTQYLFLGDYVDRGLYSVETFLLVCALKVRYPANVHVLRGNHESAESPPTDFRLECEAKFSNKWVWSRFARAFDHLPFAAIVDNSMLCVHGGLAYGLRIVELKKHPFPCPIPSEGMLNELVLNDPTDTNAGWCPNDDRNCNDPSSPTDETRVKCFGHKPLNNFLLRNKLIALIRAHEMCEEGYKLLPGANCLTVFSAWNYKGVKGNDGCVLQLAAGQYTLHRRKSSGGW